MFSAKWKPFCPWKDELSYTQLLVVSKTMAKMCNFVVSTVIVDGIASLGAKVSAGTMEFGS